MWGMLKYLILLMYKYIMWHMFEISISAYSDNYSYKKMINNFHYVFFSKLKFSYFSIIESKLYVFYENNFLIWFLKRDANTAV